MSGVIEEVKTNICFTALDENFPDLSFRRCIFISVVKNWYSDFLYPNAYAMWINVVQIAFHLTEYTFNSFQQLI